MKINPIRTEKIRTGSVTLEELLDAHLASLSEGNILAITSKVVSLCEGNTLKIEDHSKEALVRNESSYYLPAALSSYGFRFTITDNTLIPMSGIDESNGDGNYILWPKDPQATANAVRIYLAKRFNLKNVGVIITDSTCRPLRRGTSGIALAHSGFKALRDYVGVADLFDRPYKVTQADVSGGLAAAAVVAMGEGNEQTPLCLLSELGFVEFQDRNPSDSELRALRISLDDDVFAPFLKSVAWQRGMKWRRD